MSEIRELGKALRRRRKAIQLKTSGSGDRTLRRHWESYGAFVEDMKRPGTEGNPQSSIDGTPSFTGTRTYEKAIQIAEQGWPDGLERIQKMQGQIKALSGDTAERHVASFVEAGDEVDIGRFLSGEPECMIEYQPVEVPACGRVIKLVCNICASASVSTDSMFRRGAAAVMLADLLENAGLRAEIIIACGISNGGNTGAYTVMAKQAGEPLELDRLAFMLAHASSLRRLFFRAMEQVSREDFDSLHSFSYGSPMNVPFEGEGVVMVDALQWGFGNQINSDEDCVRFVNKTVSQYVELETV